MNLGEKRSTQRHAFISYVHEDKERVDRLQEALEAVGVSVWRDTKDLWPGQNWEDQIRAAIKSESLAFIACFSEHSAAKTKTYQNLELTLAADEYRLRPPSTEWLLPVRFSECSVPDYNLGAGRTLNSIHRTDLFGPSETLQTIRLAEAVKRIVSPELITERAIEPAIAAGIAEARKADSPPLRPGSDDKSPASRSPRRHIAGGPSPGSPETHSDGAERFGEIPYVASVRARPVPSRDW